MLERSRPPALDFQPVRLKTVALPIEHGAWGLLLEPIALGLLAAPSAAGGWLALMTVAAYLLRTPLKIALADRKRGIRSARTALAARVAVFYGAVALGSCVAAGFTDGVRPFLPFVVASPLLAAYLFYDFAKRGRALLAELVGPLALGVSASAIVLASGWSSADAFAVWVVLMARSLPSVLYVRARLRLERGEGADPVPAIAGAVLASLLVAVFCFARYAPLLAVLGSLGLLGRCVLGLSEKRRSASAQRIGFAEIAYGAIYVILAAIGYRLAPA